MIRGNGGVCKPAWWVQPGWQHDGRVQSSGKEITDYLPEGGNFVTGASTRNVTEMTQSVDTDARFLKFGGLAGWSIAGVSRGKVKMSHWWHLKYCPSSPIKTVKASSSIPALSAQVITKLNLTHQTTNTSNLLSMFPRDNIKGFAGDRTLVEAHLLAIRAMCVSSWSGSLIP